MNDDSLHAKLWCAALAGGAGLFAASPAAAAPINIMALGDSLTHGFRDGTNDTPFYGWRVPLYNELVGRGFDPLFLGSQTSTGGVPDGTNPANWAHEGHSGWHIGGAYTQRPDTNPAGPYQPTTPGGTTYTDNATPGEIPNNYNFNRGLLEHLPAIFNKLPDGSSDPTPGGTNASDVDLVMLSIGINDIKDITNPETAPERLIQVIDTILGYDPTIRILVSNLAPTDADYDGLYSTPAQLATAISTFNNAFASLLAGEGYGDRVQLADIYARVSAFRSLHGDAATFDDGDLHFTDAAYADLGEFYASLIPEPATAVLVMLGGAALLSRRARA